MQAGVTERRSIKTGYKERNSMKPGYTERNSTYEGSVKGKECMATGYRKGKI